jgi:hypothetical protein
MLGRKQGLGKAAGALAFGLVAAGCGGNDVSAGSESDAVNLSRCFGADCGVRAQALGGDDVVAPPCGDVEGQLADPLLFEALGPGAQAVAAVEGLEGSVWALESMQGSIYLAHFAADGALIASHVVASEAQYTVIDAALVLDSTGVVTVGVYSSFAPDADSVVIEELALSTFDSELSPLAAPRKFRGMATPELFAGTAGSIWLAGDANANAPHGVISRITNTEPDWIQTAVPSSGQGTGTGVSGLTVADDGTAAIVAGLTPKWSGQGPDILELGVSTFDVTGKPLWTLKLPTGYAPGWPPGLGGTAEGDLVVAGVVGAEMQSVLVRQISRAGVPGWAYTVDAFSPDVDVRRDSGRAFLGSTGGLAVIDAAGERCRQFSISITESDLSAAEPWRADGEYVLAVGGSLARFRVPE